MERFEMEEISWDGRNSLEMERFVRGNESERERFVR